MMPCARCGADGAWLIVGSFGHRYGDDPYRVTCSARCHESKQYLDERCWTKGQTMILWIKHLGHGVRKGITNKVKR